MPVVRSKAAGYDGAVPSSLVDFGRRLQRLRSEADLSQRQLEDATKHGPVPLSRSQISRVENGDVIPGPRWLDTYLAQCGVPVGSRAYRWWSAARRRLDGTLVEPTIGQGTAGGEQMEAGANTRPARASAYTLVVRDFAPEVLLAREPDMAEVARFCADDRPYLWWQAEPWAGKSAFAAWVALHPPAGVTTVAFFVTGRLRGQADSDAFTEAMADQLAALIGEEPPRTQSAAALDRERRRLLDAATARVRSQGSRLLLVVDGLDEDEGADPASPLPSICALLPERPPPDLKVMVTSRPRPGVPTDVSAEHPVRQCDIRALSAFQGGSGLRDRAVFELNQRLHAGDPCQVDVVAFVTAAGGGLTVADLAALTGQPGFVIAGTLDGSLGRTLQRHQLPDSPRNGQDQVVLFAHETLREMADEELASDLPSYRQRLGEWAESWRHQGWPRDTPRYLLRPYGHLLASLGKARELAVLATDGRRHDRLLAETHGDAAALTEIRDAQRLVLHSPGADLVDLGILAAHTIGLAERNSAIPADLPMVWFRLGDRRKAEALAASIPSARERTDALAGLMTELADTDQQADRDEILRLAAQAEDAVAQIADPQERLIACEPLIDAYIDADLWDEAKRLVLSAPESDERELAHLSLVEELAESQQWSAAQQLALVFEDSYWQSWALALLAHGLASGALWDQAEDVVGRITSVPHRVEALTVVVSEIASVDRERATRLATEAQRLARGDGASYGVPQAAPDVVKALIAAGLTDFVESVVTDVGEAVAGIYAGAQADILIQLSRALADGGLFSLADRVISSIADAKQRESAAAGMSQAMAAAGMRGEAEQKARGLESAHDRAIALSGLAREWAASYLQSAQQIADDAERTAALVTDADTRVRTLRALAKDAYTAGWWERAERLADSVAGRDRDDALTGLARALVEASEWDRALVVAAKVSDEHSRARVARRVAEGLSEGRAWDAAEQAARMTSEPRSRARAMSAVAAAMTMGGQLDQAARLASEAETVARMGADSVARAGALVALVSTVGVWDVDRGQRLALVAAQVIRGVAGTFYRSMLMRHLVEAIGEVGLWPRLEQIMEVAEDAAADGGRYDSEHLLSSLAISLAGAGRFHDAERIALSIDDSYHRERALRSFAREQARAGRLEDALRTTTGLRGTDEPWESTVVLVEDLVDADQPEQAYELAATITEPYWRTCALAAVLPALAHADQGRAENLAVDVEQVARTIAEQDDRIEGLGRLAHAMAHFDKGTASRIATEAERTALAVAEPDERASALAGLVYALAEIDDGSATRVADTAIATARAITDDGDRERALEWVRDELREAQMWDQAERVVGEIEGSWEQNFSQQMLIEKLIDAAEWDRADRAIQKLTEPDRVRDSLVALASGLGHARQWVRAERVLQSISSPAHRVRASERILQALSADEGTDVPRSSTRQRLHRMAAEHLTGVEPFGCLKHLQPGFPDEVRRLCDAVEPILIPGPLDDGVELRGPG